MENRRKALRKVEQRGEELKDDELHESACLNVNERWMVILIEKRRFISIFSVKK